VHFFRLDENNLAILLPDVIHDIKHSSLTWYKNEGIFYNRYDKCADASFSTTMGQKLCYRRLKANEFGFESDIDILSFPEHPEWHIFATVSESQDYLICHIRDRCLSENQIWISDVATILGKSQHENQQQDHQKQQHQFCLLVDSWSSQFHYITDFDGFFLFRTNCDAPFYCIVKYEKCEEATHCRLICVHFPGQLN
jgi:hypothetical protein